MIEVDCAMTEGYRIEITHIDEDCHLQILAETGKT